MVYTDTTIYQMLPPETGRDDEKIRYACLIEPCRTNEVVILSDKLDRHTLYHRSSHIEIRPINRRQSDVK